MQSLDEGESPILAVRVPAELNARIERWAAARGEATAEALRSLLDLVSADTPSSGVVIKPPLKWMTSEYKHSCFQKRPRRTAGCTQPWAHEPDKWVFVDVPHRGTQAGDFYDLFCSVTTYRCLHHRRWVRIPLSDMGAVAGAFRGNETRLIVHHLIADQGPYLIRAEGE